MTRTREEVEAGPEPRSHVKSREEVEGMPCSGYTVEPAKHVCKCKKPYIKVVDKHSDNEHYIMKSNIIRIGRYSPHNSVIIDLAIAPADHDSWVTVTDTLESILEQL